MSLLREDLVFKKAIFDRIKTQYESALAEVEASTKSIVQAEANFKAAQQRLKEAEVDLKETKNLLSHKRCYIEQTC